MIQFTRSVQRNQRPPYGSSAASGRFEWVAVGLLFVMMFVVPIAVAIYFIVTGK